MRMIIAPAKKIRVDLEALDPSGPPQFVDDAQVLLDWMRQRTPAELKRLWGCNDAIAAQNLERIAGMDLRRGLTPAVLAYDGIQYQYMAPSVFEEAQLAYVQDHLRILSGFYGVLRAMDGVVPYRLEMQAKAAVGGARDLYGFWGARIHDAVVEGDPVVVNLASKEYAKCVEDHLATGETFVTCVFGELQGGTGGGVPKVVQKGTYAKMARGEMVRYAAETNAATPADLQSFDRMGYTYDESRSDETTYIFVKR